MEENFRILKPFIRGSFLIILSMVIAVLAAKKYLSYVVPMYESTTKLKLADISEGVPSSNLFKDFDVFASANKIAAEIEVLKSSVLLNKTLDKLDFDVEIYRKGKLKSVELYNNSPIIIEGNFTDPKAFDKRFGLKVLSKDKFEILYPDKTQLTLEGTFGEPISMDYGNVTISLNQAFIESKPEIAIIDTYEFEFLSRQKLVGKISTNLDVVSVDKDVAIIRISFKSPAPAKAALFVNKHAETYIQDYIDTKYKAAETTVNFLDKQLYEVSGRLSKIESNIENYRYNQNIVNLRQETETELRKISQLRIQQTNIKMNLVAIEELNEYIQTGKDDFLTLAPNFEAFNDLLSTEIIKNIKSLQAEKKDLLLTYTPNEDQVKVIDRKIEDLKDYLIESIKNTKKNLEVKFINITDDIAKFERFFESIPEKEKFMTLLNREFDIYQKTYISLNEKKIEAGIAKAAKIAFHRVINPAEPSKNPVSPNRPIIIIVSAILGMFGAIVLIYIVHLAKAKVNDKYTIESNSGIPVAMLTPKLKNNQQIESHFLQEAGQLEVKGLIKNGSIICISSFKLKEGAMFNAFHLARALAIQNRRVLLVDVSDSMKNNQQLENAPIKLEDGLDLITLTDPKYKSFTKTKMEGFFENFKSSYDIILILNEALGQQKSLLLMSLATTNLVVVDARLTQAKKIFEVDLLKDEFNLPSTHFLLNRYNYNPNILLEMYIILKKIFRLGKKQSWASRLTISFIILAVISVLFFFSDSLKSWKRSDDNNKFSNIESNSFSEDNQNGNAISYSNLGEISSSDFQLASTLPYVNFESKPEQKNTFNKKSYHLIIGSFEDRKNAERFSQNFQKHNYKPDIIFQSKMNWHCVSLAAFNQKKEAKAESLKASKLLNTEVFVIEF